MSPLDDQLRAALHGRADVLVPAADPLAGIESRARGIRRRRVAASVAGAALAVTAVAVAVPSLTDGAPRTAPRYAVSPDPATASLPANALSHAPEARGLATPVLNAAVVAAWSQRHPGSGEVYSVNLASGKVETKPPVTFAVFELWRTGGPAYAVVAQDTDKPIFVRDDVLASGAPFIDAVISGPGGGPFIVFANAQGVKRVEYDPGDGKVIAHPRTGSDPADLTSGITDRTGPTGGKDALIAYFGDGRSVREDVWTGPTDGAPGTGDGEPPNLLSTWPQRGVLADGPAAQDVALRFAQGMGRPADAALYRALYSGKTAAGVRYTFGQAWFSGDTTAYDVGLALGGSNGPDFFLGPITPKNTEVLAYLVTGPSTELLVVVPSPRTAQVLYDDNGSGPFRPVSGTAATDGVVLVYRAVGATADRLQLLTGNGDPATDTTFTGSVSSLLCGLKGCG